MKKLNNKGFSLIELLAVMVILAILMTTAIAAYSTYRKQARQKAYDTMAKSASFAMSEYIMDNPSTKKVTFEELVDGEYLEDTLDPRNSEKKCLGRVTADENAGLGTNQLASNDYQVSMCCEKYNYTYQITGNKVKLVTKDSYCRGNYFNVEDIEKINVLNVYPNSTYRDYLSNWMTSYGKGKIFVTPVSIEEYNANPSAYLGNAGSWNYDVIVFGFADCNSSKDLSQASQQLTASFLDNGGSAIFGHDTITTGCGNHVNFIKLEKYVNVKATTDLSWNGSTKVNIVKKGVFTSYPYKIEDSNQLTIPTSHVYGQVASGNIWLTFDGIQQQNKSVYLTTYGNNALIQTGHTNGIATDDEQKIIANIIFYVKSKQID